MVGASGQRVTGPKSCHQSRAIFTQASSGSAQGCHRVAQGCSGLLITIFIKNRILTRSPKKFPLCSEDLNLSSGKNSEVG
jgi:hypothetical protein